MIYSLNEVRDRKCMWRLSMLLCAPTSATLRLSKSKNKFVWKCSVSQRRGFIYGICFAIFLQLLNGSTCACARTKWIQEDEPNRTFLSFRWDFMIFASASKWFYLLFCGWIKDIIEMVQHCISLRRFMGERDASAIDAMIIKNAFRSREAEKQEGKEINLGKLLRVQHEVNRCRVYYHNLEGNERPNKKKVCAKPNRSNKYHCSSLVVNRFHCICQRVHFAYREYSVDSVWSWNWMCSMLAVHRFVHHFVWVCVCAWAGFLMRASSRSSRCVSHKNKIKGIRGECANHASFTRFVCLCALLSMQHSWIFRNILLCFVHPNPPHISRSLAGYISHVARWIQNKKNRWRSRRRGNGCVAA